MNENTEFDLEWAKRGGVLRLHEELADGATILGKCARTNEVNVCVIFLAPYKFFSTIDVFSVENLRMATREECESAGVEYIDRPGSDQELAELRENKERIKFLFENANLAYLKATSSDSMDKFIEDIDAAMKGGA